MSGDERVFLVMFRSILNRGVYLHPSLEAVVQNHFVKSYKFNQHFIGKIEAKLVNLAAMAIARYNINYKALNLPQDYLDLILIHTNIKSEPNCRLIKKKVNFNPI